MADISPMCSIMVASAIGAMTKMADRLNLQRENAGTPTQEAFAMIGKRKNGGAVCVCHAHGVEDQCGNHKK